jgi:probable F420-dependent oxidoreductase
MTNRPSALGTYLLPGRVSDPRPAITQAEAAERLGLGSVWIAERWDTKEAGSLCGAVGQATSKVKVVAGMTHFRTRHPMVLAAFGSTMQALTGGRFVLGIGRAAPQVWKGFGLPVPTNAAIADHADILRRLWRGEAVAYDGPAGCYPQLKMADPPDVAPPALVLAAIGPKALALAGRCFDGVVLHPFVTTEGVTRSREIVGNAAADAGRDPDSIQVISVVVVAPDLEPSERDAVVGGRAVTYFQIAGFGERIAEINGWDVSPLQELRSHPTIAALRGGIADQAFTRDQLVDASRVLPPEWFTEGAAIGSSAQVAERLQAYIRAGSDEIVLHGTTPDRVGPTVGAFTK